MDEEIDEENKLIELDRDFDLESICPNELIKNLGLSRCSTEELLALLEKGAIAAKILLQSFDSCDMKEYYDIGKRYSPVAYALFDRLFKQGKEPRLGTHLAVNLYLTTKCEPNTVLYWNDPDAIQGLYKSLELDGYYASSPRT